MGFEMAVPMENPGFAWEIMCFFSGFPVLFHEFDSFGRLQLFVTPLALELFGFQKAVVEEFRIGSCGVWCRGWN